MNLLRILIPLLACSAVLPAVRGQRSATNARLYAYVQRLDTASGTWRTLNAKARLTVDAHALTIVIWNDWGDERINPLVRIAVGNIPEKGAENNKWRYSGKIFRSENTGKDCTIESCTIIANTKNPDFTVIGPDYSARYRISRKAFEKP